MNLSEYKALTGISYAFIAKKIGVNRSTVERAAAGQPVSLEIAELIEQFTQGKVKPNLSKKYIIKR